MTLPDKHRRVPYRQAAEVPKEEVPRRPVERYVVSRYGVYPAIAIVLASIALVAFLTWGAYGRVRIACTRTAAGATPRCQASESGLGSTAIEPFDLSPSSLKVIERSSDDGTHHAIATPSRELHRGVDQAFAEATVARAQRFVATPNELTFEAEHAHTGTATAFAACGVLFVAIIVLIMRRAHVDIDRDAGVVRVGKAQVHRLIEIETADVESIDDSAFYNLHVVMKDGTRRFVADGRERECNALAAALKRAVADLKPKKAKRAPEPEPDREESWKRAERALRDELVRFVALDPRGVTRDTDLERVEARCRFGDVEVRASMDAHDPDGITVSRDVSTELDVLEVHLDEDAKPKEGSSSPR